MKNIVSSQTMILLVILLLSLLISTGYAMRCGTHLINEGDNVSRVLQLCGNPTFNNYSTIVYTNKDGDHMNYTIHVNGAGTVDNITFSRGE